MIVYTLFSVDASLFRVAAGKEKLEYSDDESLRVQKFEVERVIQEPGYNDVTGNYAADIALVVLKKTIIFEAHIAPICIPYGLKYEEQTVEPGLRGDHQKNIEISVKWFCFVYANCVNLIHSVQAFKTHLISDI